MNELEARFAEIEKRVMSLVADNGSLRQRVAELEQELERTRLEAADAGDFHRKQARIREKIEHVLLSLESIGEKKADAGTRIEMK